MFESKIKSNSRVNPDTYALGAWYSRALAAMLLLAFVMLFTGCTTKTQYGECVGIADRQDPQYQYDVDKTNVVLGVIFLETVWVPANVLFWNFYCPVEKK